MSETMETAGLVKGYTCLKLPTPKFYPITGNQPMTCTRAGWDASCRKFQALEKNSYEKISTRHDHLTKYCSICMGDYIPDNVTFIDIPQGVEITCGLRIPEIKKPLTEEKEMAGRRYTAGNCECCGKKRNLTSHHGKTVCSSCINFRISAKNSPELVIDALKEFGNLPEAGKQVGIDPRDYVTLTEYESTITELNREKADLKKQAQEIEELNIVVENLIETIRTYQAKETSRPPEDPAPWPQSVPIHDTDVVEKFAWKLADGIIAGTITGIGIEDIRMLRALV